MQAESREEASPERRTTELHDEEQQEEQQRQEENQEQEERQAHAVGENGRGEPALPDDRNVLGDGGMHGRGDTAT